MTEVEGGLTHRVQQPSRSQKRLSVLRRPALALLGLAPLVVLPALGSPATVGAATVGSLQAQASQLQQQIQTEGEQISALGQKYDQAEDQLSSIENQISGTEHKITTDQHTVRVDEADLRTAAIDTYMSDGALSSVSPLFSGNQSTAAAAQEYGEVATGNLQVDVANLHTAQIALNAEKDVLDNQRSAQQSAVNAAAAAKQSAVDEQAELQSSLDQVQGQLGALERQDQNEANASVTAARLASTASFPPPPPNSAGGAAVAAAESQLGVPYVWGGETPGVGFDCSGLTAWAWGQAGVPLPHYSGAQMADSTPVPVSDLEPGDLLFYGPGGSQHVAMYVGGGEMIEAPYTGAYVWITALRLGDGFVGAGRP